MQILEFRDAIIHKLTRGGVENATMQTSWIFSAIANLNSVDFFTNPTQTLNADQVFRINSLVENLITGEPLAYLLQSTQFYGLDFFINSDVLIPRNDTETLVDFILHNENLHRQMSKSYTNQRLEKSKPTQTRKTRMALSDNFGANSSSSFKVLDLCTGSGVIGLSLQWHRRDWQISLSDISLPALKVARKNAELLHLDVEILHSDLFQKFDKCEKFNLIVANPPYISESDPHLANLQREPILALTAKNNGLEILQKIILQSRNYLTSAGILILEHGYDQSQQVQKMLQDAGFTQVASQQDLGKNTRFSLGFFSIA